MVVVQVNYLIYGAYNFLRIGAKVMTTPPLNSQKPKSVVIATYFLWGSLAFIVLDLVLNWTQYLSVFPPNFPYNKELFSAVIYGIIFSIPLLLIIKTSSGRNWARIANLIILLLMMFSYFQFFKEPPTSPKIATLITSMGIIITHIIAVILLFSNPATAWFRALKSDLKNEKMLKKESLTLVNQQRNLLKPKRVILATKLLWATQIIWTSLAIGFVVIAAYTSKNGVSINTDMPSNELVVPHFIVFFSLILTFTALIFPYNWIILKISSGKNWARLVLLSIFIIGSLFLILNLLAKPSRIDLIFLITILPVFIALWLLFTKPGATWFKEAERVN